VTDIWHVRMVRNKPYFGPASENVRSQCQNREVFYTF
jgi:hypothetical protein